MSVGGVAVFPADTVYGLACDPDDKVAVERLYTLKRRSFGQAVGGDVLRRLACAGGAARAGRADARGACSRLLPGAVSVLLPNPAGRFPLACGDDPSTLGLRVPVVPLLAGVRWPVLQSSANRAGGPDPRRLRTCPS